MKLCPLCETVYPTSHTTCGKEGCGARLVESRLLEPGTVIREKYRILKFIGRGGMGTVYLAEHIHLNERHALKFISGDLTHDPKVLKRFRQEAQSLRRLTDPNIVEVYDLDQSDDGSFYIAMEFVDGLGLREVISVGPLPVHRAIAIARGVASGLAAAHAKQIIHRDIKPDNILLDHSAFNSAGIETPKLLDFGIAAVKETSAALSRTHGVMLTPQYAAPEQWAGTPADQIDGRTDLYALGGVFYEMLTGTTCLHSHTFDGWMYQHLQAERTAPSKKRPELANWPGLDALVLSLLAKDHNHRPATATAVIEQLDKLREVRGSQVIHNNRSTKVESTSGYTQIVTSRPGSRKLPLRIAFAVAALAAIATIGFRVYHTPHPALADTPTAGALRQNPRDGLTYAWIPAGSFLMGCSPGDANCALDERPAHVVDITKGYWMGQTPVTVAAWKLYRTAGNAPRLPSVDPLGRTNWNEAGPDNMPVVMETWEQASSYCQWAGMSLPTEAQWEYAARAGTQGPYYGSLDSVAWYGNNSGDKTIDAAALWASLAQGTDAGGTYERLLKANGNFIHPVATLQPNQWKLLDMLGNVLEWTADWYSADYSKTSHEQNDSLGPPTSTSKVARGGSYENIADWLRVSHRVALPPSGNAAVSPGVGFRCAGQL